MGQDIMKEAAILPRRYRGQGTADRRQKKTSGSKAAAK
jgi:hypothetical protein